MGFDWNAEWFTYDAADGTQPMLKAQAIADRLLSGAFLPNQSIALKSQRVTGFVAADRLVRLFRVRAGREAVEEAFTTKERPVGPLRSPPGPPRPPREAPSAPSPLQASVLALASTQRLPARPVAPRAVRPPQADQAARRANAPLPSPPKPTHAPLLDSRFLPLWKWQALRKLGGLDEHRALAREWARHRMERPDEWFLVDTETTGLSAQDQVIEIAIGAVHLSPSGMLTVRPVFNQRIRPTIAIPWASTQVHGITDAMVRSAPRFEDVAPRIASLCAGRALLAWNASFDARMVRQTAERFGVESPCPTASWQCAMRAHAVWKAEPGNRTLYRTHRLGGDHSAFGDIETMARRIHSMATT